MLVEMTELIGRQVYTQDGRFLGDVANIVVDVESARVDGLFIAETNQLLVEDSKSVNVPYRWVSAVNDVVLLKYFPKRVSVKKSAPLPGGAKRVDADEEAPPAPTPMRAAGAR